MGSVRALGVLGLVALVGCGARYQPLECPTADPGEGYELQRTAGRYDVGGKTFAAYTEARKKAAPFGLFITPDRPALALTDSRTCFRYTLTEEEGQCTLGRARLLHLVRVTTPRWTGADGASPADLELLRADDAVLTTHEEGHARIAEAAARHTLAAVQKLSTASTCAELDAKVKAVVADLAKETAARQKAYDEATDHGRKQGAVQLDALPWVGWE